MGKTVGLETQIRLQNQAIRRIENGILVAVREVFEGEVVPAAREMCPVSTEVKPGGVHTAESIACKVRRYRGKIRAAVFTNSGHGGYVEHGTKKMAAQPFIYPAFERSLPALNALLKTRIEEFGNLDAIVEDGGVEALATALKAGEWKGRTASQYFPDYFHDERTSGGFAVERSGKRVSRDQLWKRYFRNKKVQGQMSWPSYLKAHGY